MRALEEIRRLKTLMNIALFLFSDMGDVIQSPQVYAIAERLILEKSSKAKYPMPWNINQLQTSIVNSEMEHDRLLMRKTVALLVAFSGARVIEFEALQRIDIEDS
ncbi:MAG: hypothetical protein EZS28_039307 [Streblomastix strix]|uniref:Tyr recombinase domain-containing protein n=1 Tax=Streblomastix strix TaxID=222440 RepID=A0A5J4U3J9_9EUKA|nr:MAG: hypothetical protein EZS28_039307 [Streblomastix strix]